MSLRLVCLALVLWPAVVLQGQPPDETAIIQAVLHDARILKGWPGMTPDGWPAPAFVSVLTESDPGHAWSPPSGTPYPVLDKQGQALQVPAELLAMARQLNAVPLSLELIPLPPGLQWNRKGHRGAKLLTLSRPGVSADGTRAVVGLSEWVDRPPAKPRRGVLYQGFGSGYVVYLERIESTWRVIARSVGWLS